MTDSQAAEAPQPNVCVIYATRGRADVLAKVVPWLERQTLQPASILISCVTAEDAGTLAGRPGVSLLVGRPGSSAQRNHALRQLPAGADIVVFFDDDFVPHPTWIEVVARTFRARPDAGSITGHLIADDIKGPGLSFEDAVKLVDSFDGRDLDWIQEPYSPYGCNMAFRRQMLDGLTFDERLVLYGWLEDRDFGAALARRGGRLLKVGAALGVHMGVKTGRVSGLRLGYSQIVNPIYLHRKGTMSPTAVADHICRNLASNLVRSIAPEAYVDRVGRLRGNMAGIGDLLRGRLTPERAELL